MSSNPDDSRSRYAIFFSYFLPGIESRVSITWGNWLPTFIYLLTRTWTHGEFIPSEIYRVNKTTLTNTNPPFINCTDRAVSVNLIGSGETRTFTKQPNFYSTRFDTATLLHWLHYTIIKMAAATGGKHDRHLRQFFARNTRYQLCVSSLNLSKHYSVNLEPIFERYLPFIQSKLDAMTF